VAELDAAMAPPIDVTQHLGLARWHVGRLLGGAESYAGVDRDDLVQEACLGLMRAAEKFDPAFGTRFSTYATGWCRQFVQRTIQNNATAVRTPVHAQEKRRKAGVAMRPRVDSLDAPFQTRRGDDADRTWHDVLGGSAPLPDAGCDSLDRERVIAGLVDAAQLTERERDVLRRRFTREQTLDAIAGHYGLTRERIRQVEAKALRKLRDAAERLGVEEEI